MNSLPIFHCKCKKPKSNRLIMDGGSEGNYVVELCPQCYANQDKKFLIREEVISSSKISLSQNTRIG